MRMWVTFYIWATAPGIWGLLFGHLQLMFLFLSGLCCANIKPQIPLVWQLTGDCHFLRMNGTIRTNPGPSNSRRTKILEPHTPRNTSHFHTLTSLHRSVLQTPGHTHCYHCASPEGQPCMWEHRTGAPLVFTMTCTAQVFALFSHETVLEKAKICTFQTWSHQYIHSLAKVPQDVMRTAAQTLDVSLVCSQRGHLEDYLPRQPLLPQAPLLVCSFFSCEAASMPLFLFKPFLPTVLFFLCDFL